MMPLIFSTALANGAMAAATVEAIDDAKVEAMMFAMSALSVDGGAMLEGAGVTMPWDAAPDRTDAGRGRDG